LTDQVTRLKPLKALFPETEQLTHFSDEKDTIFNRAVIRLSATRLQHMKPSRAISPPGTYFVTFSTFQRTRLFVVESYTRLFLTTLYGYKRQGAFQLHAFVVMPDHVHLLITPTVTLERAMQLIKGGYSHAFGTDVGRKNEVGQRGFTDHRIRDAADFELHRGYIHQNPVKRGLVMKASEYRYCSAYPGFRLDGWPLAVPASNLSMIPHGKGTTYSPAEKS